MTQDFIPTTPDHLFTVRHFDEVSSTSKVARELAAQGAGEWLVVSAEYQTEGYGKLGRKWESPRGKNLLFSVILRPDISVAKSPMLTQIACRSVATVLKENYALHPVFKRPNDVVIAGRKICGILIETSSAGDSLEAVIVGIGLNVNTCGNELFPGATSLKEETGKETDRAVLLRQILERLAEDVRNLL
jgi:BirA family biotin operon repressor/biotin-[acetyl-CoA-carboxylase] ligase